MARATVRIPQLLADLVRSSRDLAVEADTVRGAIDELCGVHPAVRVHLFDGSGSIRRHVNVGHGGVILRDGSELDAPLADGDEVLVIQAVSGG